MHATIDHREAERDVFMLLGSPITDIAASPSSPWSRTPRRQWHRDVVGAHGWGSLRELLTALDVCLRYVLLWSETNGVDGRRLTLLVDDWRRARDIAVGRPDSGDATTITCRVAGERVVLALRELGDGTLDPTWQRAMLRHQLRLADGTLVPSPEDRAYCLLYELVAHTPPGTSRPATSLSGLTDWLPQGDYADARFARAVLETFMLMSGYDYALPHDESIWRNPAVLGRGPRARRSLRRRAPKASRIAGRMLRIATRT